MKLAVEHYEKHNRPIKIAIDTSIWQYQVQAGKGGTNPALRTFYYRLLRLLSWSIQPLFVFDGAHKPPFKRGKKTSSDVVSLPNMMAKEMLKLFGFPYHTAPGEAEAECAILQQEGIVDAVLSEDVDTLMFGCTISLRNWSSEGTRGNKSPTHINVYYAQATKGGRAKLDREDMILIALMSGGDYIPAGIPGCGIKTACEAARAGFGKDLCRIPRKDTIGLNQWRERLDYELRTNESGHFRQKHRNMQIPSKFPDPAVLGYYTNPVVSSSEKISDLRNSITWDNGVDIQALRLFVADAFEWHYLDGANKFIRGLAPALFNHYLLNRRDPRDTTGDELDTQAEQEKYYVKAICGRRLHFTTDGIPELRIAYLPSSIVNLDLSQEESSSYAGINGVESDSEPHADDVEPQQSPSRKRNPSTYDPTQIEKVWIPETFVKIGVPLLVETWEEDMRDPRRFATRKAREREALAGGTKKKSTTINSYAKVSKPSVRAISSRATASSSRAGPESTLDRRSLTPSMPVLDMASQTGFKKGLTTQRGSTNLTSESLARNPNGLSKPATVTEQKSSSRGTNWSKNWAVNSWTLSKRSSTNSGKVTISIDLTALERPDTPKRCNSDSTVKGTLLPTDNRSLDLSKADNINSGPRTYEPDPLSDSPTMKRVNTRLAHRSKILETENSVAPSPPGCLEEEWRGLERRHPQPFNSEEVNRSMKFDTLHSSVDLSSSPQSSPVPSPSSMIHPPRRKDANFLASETAPVQINQGSAKAKRAAKTVRLRESLSGTWSAVDTSGSQKQKHQCVFEEVEILDLTGT